MRENEYIAMFSGIHGTAPFAADAERFGNRIVSMDSFSETEDFFTHTPPETIGHNLAAAACSDLLACGAKPEILIQSWNIDDSKDMEYYKMIASGIEKVLCHYGVKCLGGDLGSARPWQWTATVSAECPEPIMRTTSRREPFDLYISGPMGRANLAVLQGTAMPEIPLRDPVPREALFATDTSGGFFDALENFRRINSGMLLRFEAEKVVAPDIAGAGVDPMLFLIGGVGEYELVYAMPRGLCAPGIKVGEGEFGPGKDNSFRWSLNGQNGVMRNPPPDYRNLPPEQWFAATADYLREMMT